MSNDLIKILLQAEISDSSIKGIEGQIKKIQSTTNPVKINVDSAKAVQSLEKLEQVTKKNLMLDLERMSGRYKNLIKPDDVTNIKSMINALSHTDPKLGHNIDLIKVKMKETSVGAEQSRRSLDLANKSAMSFGESMKQAAYKFGIWSAITASYYKVIREIAAGVRFVTEMDTALTEIGMVTNQNREQVAGLAKEYNNLAKEMKVLTSEVTSGAVEFYRQGLSQEEVMDRLRVTTMYSKVANLEFTQSAELLTATVNSMGIDIERAADVFTFLGDATATGADEIGIGFSQTSGAAAALGVEFEKVASWIAVISSRTRESAQSIGHSINTMLSRLSRITTTGFNEEDDTKINDVAKALNSVDIALTDTDGNFRDFGTILDEINAKWSSLDDQTKSYVANTMAGTRQQSRFFNLMEGYAESIDLYEESLEAAGTAQSKFNLYMESNQATLDTFRTTIEGLWTTVIDSDSLMNIVRMGTSFIEVLDGMVQSLGTVGTVASFLIPLFGIKLVSSFKATYLEMMKLYAANNMTLLPSPASVGATIKSMLGFTTTVKGATVATGGLTIATAGLTLGISALVAGVMWWANESKKAKEAFANALDNSQQLNEDLDSLESLIKKQEDLIKVENKSVEKKEELVKVQRELAQLYPELATGIDEEGNKIADNIELTKELTEEKRRLLEQELLVIKTTANQKLPQLKKELADMQDEADKIQQRLLSGDVYETVNYEGYDIQINKTDDLKKRLLELVDTQKDHYEEIVKLESGVKSHNKMLEENEERQKWATAAELERQSANIKSESQYRSISKALKDLGFTSDEVSKIMKGNLNEVKDKYNVLTDAQIENLTVVENLNEADRIAATEMLERSKTLTESIIQNTKARILAIRSEIESLIGRDGAGSTYLDKTYGMHPAKQALSDELKRQEEELAKETHENLKRIAEIDKALANIGGLSSSGSISGTKDGKSSSSSSAKDNRQFLETIDAEIRAIKLRNDNLIKTSNLLREQLDAAKDIEGIEGLNEQYRLTGELIAHNEKVMQSFKEEQDAVHKRANDIREQYSQYDIDSWFDTNGEQTAAYINLYNSATKDQQEEMSKIFGWVQKLKQAWADADGEVKNVLKTNKELEKSSAAISKNTLSERLANSKDWIEKRKFYDDWGADNEIAAWERVKAYIQDYYTQGIINHKEYSDYMFEIDKNLANARQQLIDERERVQREYLTYRTNQEIKDLERQKQAVQDNADRRIKAIETTISLLQERLDLINEEIDTINKLKDLSSYIIDEEIRQIEIQKNEIKTLYDLKISNIEDEIARLEERNDLLNEEQERQQKLLDIEEQKRRLENTLKERNVRIYQNGDWAWVADPKKVKDETDKLKGLQDGYNKWEEDITKKKEIEALKDQVKTLQDQLKLEEKHYDDQIYNLQEFIKEHTRITHEFHGDEVGGLEDLINRVKLMESTSYSDRMFKLKPFLSEYLKITKESRLEQLQTDKTTTEALIKTNDERIKAIRDETQILLDNYDRQIRNLNRFMSEYNDRNEEFYLTQIEELDELIEDIKDLEEDGFEDRLKQLLDFIKEYNKLIGNMDSPRTEDWSGMYMDARARGDWETMEYANRQANIERGAGNVVTSDVDIESVKNKSSSSGSSSSPNIVRANSDGKAPPGQSVGTIVKTNGGDYQITKVNKDGSYESKKIEKRSYAHGGKITDTGTFLTDFHGKQSDPEWIFNDTQLQKVLKSAVLSTVNIAIPKIPSLQLVGGAGGTGGGASNTYHVHVAKVETPDAESFVNFLPSLVKQYK